MEKKNKIKFEELPIIVQITTIFILIKLTWNIIIIGAYYILFHEGRITLLALLGSILK